MPDYFFGSYIVRNLTDRLLMIIKDFDAMKLIEFSCTAEGKMEHNVCIRKYDNDKHNGEYWYRLFHFMKC